VWVLQAAAHAARVSLGRSQALLVSGPCAFSFAAVSAFSGSLVLLRGSLACCLVVVPRGSFRSDGRCESSVYV